MLELGNSGAWWRPWPHLGRSKIQLQHDDYVNSIPVPDHQLNLKRHLFYLVRMNDGSSNGSLIAVPKGDVQLVERWFRQRHLS